MDVYYDVPLVIQARNPICWVASMAMIESWWTKSSVGVGKYTGGFDPSSSCIPNPASDVWDFQNRMAGFSFYPVYPDGPMTLNGLGSLLGQFGPLLLFHNLEHAPWGAGAKGAHAVVITGVTGGSGGWIWINNPWGSKDLAAPASTSIQCAVWPASSSFSLYWGYFP
ncbi:MAG: papain-like cysteine protease family protein [Rhodanobacter sp.]